MVSVRSSFATALVALACLAYCSGAAQAAPNNMVALGTGANANTLYRFSGDSPGTIGAVPVSGLGGNTLVGIDFRPLTGELFGLGVIGSATTLFAIDPVTGTAAQVGLPATVPPIVGATEFGFSFNPTADRLRVVDNQGDNFRLRPDTGALAGLDTPLVLTGLPGGSANAPLAAVSYDRKVAGTTKTTAFGIVSGGDRLVTLGGVDATPSPNGGMLFDIGPLGVDVTVHTGFDIDPTTGEPFMAAESGDLTGLYRIDLATGAATGIGQIGDGSVDLGSLTIGGPAFVPPPPPPPPAEPKLEALSISPKRFAAVGGKKAKATGSTVAAPRGTTVSYTLSAPARVAFSIEEKTVGRMVGGKCKQPTKGNHGRKPCSLWRLVQKSGSPRKGIAGSNSFFFSGRIHVGRKLLPGRSGFRALPLGSYRFVAKLSTTALTANFQIVPAVPGPPPVR